MSKQVSLKLTEEWKAVRTEEGRWYFFSKTVRSTTWDPPVGCPDYTYAELDAVWRQQHPVEELPPPSQAAQAQTELQEQARREKALHAQLSRLQALSIAPESRLVGPGTWTMAAGLRNISSEVGTQQAVAAALAASAPGFGGSEVFSQEWQRLASAMAAPDAVFREDVRQLITSAPEGLMSQPAVQAASRELLGASFSTSISALPQLVSLLDRYKPQADKLAAMVQQQQQQQSSQQHPAQGRDLGAEALAAVTAQAAAAAAAAAVSGQANGMMGRAVSFEGGGATAAATAAAAAAAAGAAATTGAGVAADAGAASTAVLLGLGGQAPSGNNHSSVSSEDIVAKLKSGGQAALASRLQQLFQQHYSSENSRELIASLDTASGAAGEAALKRKLRLLLESEGWRRRLVALSEKQQGSGSGAAGSASSSASSSSSSSSSAGQDDAFLEAALDTMFEEGYHYSVVAAPAGLGRHYASFKAVLLDILLRREHACAADEPLPAVLGAAASGQGASAGSASVRGSAITAERPSGLLSPAEQHYHHSAAAAQQIKALVETAEFTPLLAAEGIRSRVGRLLSGISASGSSSSSSASATASGQGEGGSGMQVEGAGGSSSSSSSSTKESSAEQEQQQQRLLSSLRLGRLRQELGYSLLQGRAVSARSGYAAQLAAALSVLPAPGGPLLAIAQSEEELLQQQQAMAEEEEEQQQAESGMQQENDGTAGASSSVRRSRAAAASPLPPPTVAQDVLDPLQRLRSVSLRFFSGANSSSSPEPTSASSLSSSCSCSGKRDLFPDEAALAGIAGSGDSAEGLHRFITVAKGMLTGGAGLPGAAGGAAGAAAGAGGALPGAAAGGAASGKSASSIETSGSSAAEGTESAAELEVRRLSLAVQAAEPLSLTEVRVILECLSKVGMYMLQQSAVEGLREARLLRLEALEQQHNAAAEAEAAVEAGAQGVTVPEVDPEGVLSQQIAELEAVLGTASYVGSVLSQPDVIAMLLHILFHPAIPLDDASLLSSSTAAGAEASGKARAGGAEEGSQEQEYSSLESIGSALAWSLEAVGQKAAIQQKVAAALAAVAAGQDPSSLDVQGYAPSEMQAALPLMDSSLPRGAAVADTAISSLITTLASSTTAAVAAGIKAGAAAGGGSAGEGKEGPSMQQMAALSSVLRQSIIESSKAVKTGGALANLANICSYGTVSSFSSSASTYAAIKAALQQLSLLMVRGLSFPVLAQAALHFFRHSLLQLSTLQDPRLLTVGTNVLRAASLLGQRWPLLAPSVLDLFHHCSLLPLLSGEGGLGGGAAGTGVPAAAARAFLEKLVDQLAEFCLSCEAAVLPCLAYVHATGSSGRWESALLRRFLQRLLPHLSPPYSLPFCLALANLLLLVQSGLCSAIRAGGGPTSAGALSVPRTIADGCTEHVKAFFAAAYEAFVRKPPAQAAAAVSAVNPGLVTKMRAELTAAIKQIDEQAKATGVL